MSMKRVLVKGFKALIALVEEAPTFAEKLCRGISREGRSFLAESPRKTWVTAALLGMALSSIWVWANYPYTWSAKARLARSLGEPVHEYVDVFQICDEAVKSGIRKDQVDALEKLTASRSYTVRMTALAGLEYTYKTSYQPRAIAISHRLLKDPDGDVRMTAIGTLHVLNSPDILDIAYEMQKNDKDDGVQDLAKKIISAKGQPSQAMIDVTERKQ